MHILLPRLSWLGLVMVAGLATGCAQGRGGTIPYATQMPAPDTPGKAMSVANYLVMPGDVLTIDVFQAEQLSKDYTVDPTGNLAIPLIGSIIAAGKSIPELRRDIASRLAQTYMNNPDVSIALKESVNRTVTVDGAVRQPGMFSVTSPLTLIQAVAMAKGTDEGANAHRVGIFRTVDGKRVAAAFDLTSIRDGEEPDPQIYPGDIVVVAGGKGKSTLLTVLQTLPVLALFRPY